MAQYILAKTQNDIQTRISLVKIPHPALNDVYQNIYFKGYTTKIIDESALPDLTYQSAFSDFDSNGKITVNMDAAKKIKMKSIRAIRNNQLRILDKQAEAAYDAKDTAAQASIETQKQTLRDLPKTVDLSSATTLTDLQNVWPAGLPKQ